MSRVSYTFTIISWLWCSEPNLNHLVICTAALPCGIFRKPERSLLAFGEPLSNFRFRLQRVELQLRTRVLVYWYPFLAYLLLASWTNILLYSADLKESSLTPGAKKKNGNPNYPPPKLLGRHRELSRPINQSITRFKCSNQAPNQLLSN